MLFNMVAEKSEGFTKRKFKGSQATSISLVILGFPS